MATTPQQNPSPADLARELAMAANVVANPPGATYTPPGGGPERKRGMTKPLFWSANVAWWDAYPDAAAKIDPNDAAAVASYNRVAAEVARLQFSKSLGQQSASWNPDAPTWPLPTPPAPWGAGSKYMARRPWLKKYAQTRYHTGVDLAVEAGVPLLAPEAGTIVAPESGWEMKGTKGVKALIMQTASGLTVLLGGIRPGSAKVVKGQQVEAGQELATIGNYPGGDHMLHFTAYKGLLTEAQVNKRKSWAVNTPAPQDLIDPTEYLQAAATNPRFTTVGLYEGGDQPGLVPNDPEGGEVSEGVEPAAPAPKPVAGDVIAANGRTGAVPCLGGMCSAEDGAAWQAAVLMYRQAAGVQLKAAEARVAKGKKWSPLADEARKNLAVVDQFITEKEALGVLEYIPLAVDACRSCLYSGKTLQQFAKPAPPPSGLGGIIAAVAGAAVVTVVVIAVASR